MNKFLLITIFLFVPIVISEEVSDPFEDLNRVAFEFNEKLDENFLKPIAITCLLYTSPSPRDGLLSRMPSSA